MVTAEVSDRIPALTVRNPWAWAIWQAATDPRAKLIENRGAVMVKLSYRGPLYIHAGWAWSDRGQFDARVMRLAAGADPADESHPGAFVPRPAGTKHRIAPETPPSAHGMLEPFPWPVYGGGIIARADLVDIHLAAGCCKPWGEDVYENADGSFTDQVAHLVLERVVQVKPPVKASGSLGLWYPDGFMAMMLDRRLEDSDG